MTTSEIPRCPNAPGEMPGSLCALVAKTALPDAAQTRRTLLRLRGEHGLSRGKLAALLGVDVSVLRRWEDGSRRPCAPARRTVQLVDRAFFRPGDFPTEPLLSVLAALRPDMAECAARLGEAAVRVPQGGRTDAHRSGEAQG
jgi:transcriptional regulator with XRE-family HTH domain